MTRTLSAVAAALVLAAPAVAQEKLPDGAKVVRLEARPAAARGPTRPRENPPRRGNGLPPRTPPRPGQAPHAVRVLADRRHRPPRRRRDRRRDPHGEVRGPEERDRVRRAGAGDGRRLR